MSPSPSERTRSAARRPARDPSRSEGSRERILDAAEALFLQNGFAATGIAAVCKRSKLPASSLYWHFQSKTGLLGAVIERGQNRLMAEMTTAFGSDFQIERAIEHAFSLIGTERTAPIRLVLQIGMERAPRDPAIAKKIGQLRARALDFHERMFLSHFEAEGVPEAQRLAAQCARMTMTFAQGSILLHRMSPETSDLKQSARDLIAAIQAVRAQHESETRSRASKRAATRPSRTRR